MSSARAPAPRLAQAYPHTGLFLFWVQARSSYLGTFSSPALCSQPLAHTPVAASPSPHPHIHPRSCPRVQGALSSGVASRALPWVSSQETQELAIVALGVATASRHRSVAQGG